MKNFIQINGKQIKISDETAQSLEEQFTKKKEFIKEGQEYWTLGNGSICHWYWNSLNQYGYKDYLARDNVYFTEAEAKKADDKRLALGTIMQYIRDNGLEFEPDWEDEFRNKHQIVGWDYDDKKPIGNIGQRVNYSSHNLVFKLAEDKQKVLDNCAKELKTLLT